MILALGLQPTQLRIGSYISRGSHEAGVDLSEQGPEFARVVNGGILVAPYTSKQGGVLLQGRHATKKKGDSDKNRPISAGVGNVRKG